MFPSWTAAIVLVKENSASAAEHAAAAVRSDDGGARLDHAVRAMNSFDHAVDNAQKLPIDWFVSGAKGYFRGYEIARDAVDLLIASNVIPGARTRVGRQSIVGAKEMFLNGVEATTTERGRFRNRLAGGWLEATHEDASKGVALLKGGDTGKALLAGISQVRAAATKGKPLDAKLVGAVTSLFDRAATELYEIEQSSDGHWSSNSVDRAKFAQAGELLSDVATRAGALVTEADAIATRVAG